VIKKELGIRNFLAKSSGSEVTRLMVFGLETKVKTKPLTNIVSCVMYWTSHLVVTGNIIP
jgi:hypothetical protein